MYCHSGVTVCESDRQDITTTVLSMNILRVPIKHFDSYKWLLLKLNHLLQWNPIKATIQGRRIVALARWIFFFFYYDHGSAKISSKMYCGLFDFFMKFISQKRSQDRTFINIFKIVSFSPVHISIVYQLGIIK